MKPILLLGKFALVKSGHQVIIVKAGRQIATFAADQLLTATIYLMGLVKLSNRSKLPMMPAINQPELF